MNPIARSLSIVALSLVATMAGISAALCADPDYAAPGTFAVQAIDETWSDTVRRRELPLRIRLPQTGPPAPLIVFSHGLGGSRAGGTEWSRHWASHGFAVVHVQHPGSDESLWQDKPVAERMPALRGGANVAQFLARIADVKFVVSELARRRQAGDPTASRLDLDRLGMSGHSFGAITTLYLGGQRPAVPLDNDLSEQRFRAFLAFSPKAGGADLVAQFAAFTRPALLVTGTLDGQPFPGLGASPGQRLIPFEAMTAIGNKYLLVIDNADHMYFNGTPGLRDLGVAGREAIDFAAVEARGYRQIRAISTAYWAAYLRDDVAARRWLKGGGAAALAGTGDSFRMK